MQKNAGIHLKELQLAKGKATEISKTATSMD